VGSQGFARNQRTRRQGLRHSPDQLTQQKSRSFEPVRSRTTYFYRAVRALTSPLRATNTQLHAPLPPTYRLHKRVESRTGLNVVTKGQISAREGIVGRCT
jgi:hypothetical protein